MESTHSKSVEDLDRLALLAEHRVDELESELVRARRQVRIARDDRSHCVAQPAPAWLRCADFESDWDAENAAYLMIGTHHRA
jgi:hypothetical protein